MIGYYRRTFSQLHWLLHAAADDPGAAVSNAYELQYVLVRSLIRVEKRIKTLRRSKAALRHDVRQPRDGESARERSRILKGQLSMAERRLSEYESVRRLLLSFGDGLAHIYLNRRRHCPYGVQGGRGLHIG